MIDLEAAQTLGDVARLQALARGEVTAFRFEGRSTTFAEFNRHACQIANGLLAEGVTKGSRVCHLGKNSDAYFEALVGAAKAGAVMAPINWRLAPPEIAYIINDCAAEILFVGPEFLGLARELAPQLSTIRKFILLEGGDRLGPDFAGWRDAHQDHEPAATAGWNDVVLQLYTSGTTGRPKGAMIRNSGILGMRRQRPEDIPEWNRWNDSDVALVAMPVFHIGGTGWGITTLVNGAEGIIAREFDPHTVLDYIERDGITKIFMVPAAMQIVVRHPRAREVDYSRIKYILYGASPIPLDLLRECMTVFGCGFVQMYGMTETTGTIVALPPEDHDPRGNERMRSAGKPLAGVEIAILDEDGNPLPPRQVGEIATRSIANMAGYWKMEDATAKTIDANGWLRTGDAGYVDEDGYVYIHDRVKDMIISGGENVYPAEVENAIFGHPDVADVAVIGVPDAKWGEAVKAIVVAKTGSSPSPSDIIQWARARIAGYKTPKSVDFVEALPRNPSGKILRRQLREPFWEGKERRVN